MFIRTTAKLALLLATLMLVGCDGVGFTDKAIQRLGVLKVAIVKTPHIYESNDQIIGFEYDLIQKYTDYLGVDLEPVYVDGPSEVSELIAARQVHLGLGMLPVTEASNEFTFGPSIKMTDVIVVTHTDAEKIASIEDLAKFSVAVSYPGLSTKPFSKNQSSHFSPTEMADSNADTLLALVDQNAFDAAIITEADFLLLKRKYPYLQKRFTLTESIPIAWVMPKRVSQQFLNSLSAFFKSQNQSGYLAKRWHFHYDHLRGFDFVDARAFVRKYASALPQFRDEFEQAAYDHEYDWRLLAALSYQESHWNPNARSPTGVRGMMMLTANTAKELGVSRLDPIESIHGGTRYLATLQARLDDEITTENQPLLALAAYNLGFGHLKDAQRVAQHMNKDSSEWAIVKAHLPLLAKEKFAKQTRYGRARGGQAVRYVEGVRRYFSILRLLEPTNWADPAKRPVPQFWHGLSVLF